MTWSVFVEHIFNKSSKRYWAWKTTLNH